MRTAETAIAPAPPKFEPFGRWALRYVELMLWLDATQQQRLDDLTRRLDALEAR